MKDKQIEIEIAKADSYEKGWNDCENNSTAVHFHPETPLEHHWFNLGHQSNKIAEENNYIREKLLILQEALEFIDSQYNGHAGDIAREALAKIRGEG